MLRHRHASPQDLYEKLKARQTLIILDIRNPQDFTAWSIYQSINIPYHKLPRKMKSLSKEKEIITVCANGKDSLSAAAMLSKNGYQAKFLAGGLREWSSVYDIVEVNPSTMTSIAIYQVKRLGKGCLSYIIVTPSQKKALIIDPSYQIKVYTDFLKEHKLKLAAVVDTHIHADHVSGAFKLSKKYKIPYLLSEDSPVSFKFKKMEKHLQKYFKEIDIDIILTPGHTKESVSISIGQSYLLTGDTLFLDTVGRSDLSSDDDSTSLNLYQSITQKLFYLDEDIYVLPAHSPTTMVPGPVRGATLRYVKKFNQISDIKSAEDFIEKLASNSVSAPNNYIQIKNINISGKIPRGTKIDELELGYNHCESLSTANH